MRQWGVDERNSIKTPRFGADFVGIELLSAG
uniref:Uncharacterized protein n=1 Tax=Arundo donax TaxID=35708 RepID=A0A0A9CD11_ARUDO